jgi:hypothetical protein
MSPRWKWFLPGYVLALPVTLCGLVFAFLLEAHSFEWRDGCLECRSANLSWALAMTLGWLIIWQQGETRTVKTSVHERVHVVQGFALGPLQAILYGLFIAYSYVRTFRNDPGWEDDYSANPFERQAYSRESRPGAWGS